VNCAAIPPSLIASELFGHEKGAFTGAIQRRLGRFELADGVPSSSTRSVIFRSDTQLALLRVLRSANSSELGGRNRSALTFAVIAATNSDLEAALADGEFRSDLFYRLNVFPIDMPPLRARRERIFRFWSSTSSIASPTKAGEKIRLINKKTLELLQSYSGQGNIRELQNVVERAVIAL